MYRRVFLILFLSGLTLVAHNQTHSLDFNLKEGLQNCPLLSDCGNQINPVMTGSLLIRAVKKPLVEAKSQLEYSPFYRNFGYDEVITDGGNYMAVMGVTQNIFNKRELDNEYKARDPEKQLKTTDQLMRALKEQLESGNIRITEYINAIKKFKSASRNLNLINIRKLQVINEMDFLLTQ